MSPRKGPIAAVVDLADSFTVDEWTHAAHIAADHSVEQVCMEMARLARRRLLDRQASK